jgi:cold shock CspA family protein
MFRTVKRFDRQKRLQFHHARMQASADVFVHVHELRKGGLWELKPGDRVSYQLCRGRSSGTTRACNVRVDHSEEALSRSRSCL